MNQNSLDVENPSQVLSKKVIVVELSGGLGNQLFQYAFGRTLADMENCDLTLDLSFFKKKAKYLTPRHYMLHNYNIRASICSKVSIITKIKIYLARISPRLGLKVGVRVENGNGFDIAAALDTASRYFRGYWQSPLYFSNSVKNIYADLLLAQSPSTFGENFIKKIDPMRSIMLHIRRGDYIKNPRAAIHHGSLDLEYYINAVTIAKSAIQDPIFYIFSDDINWCKEAFGYAPNINYVHLDPERGEWEDLLMMSYCRHHIIANSSFSWWAAWLADQHYGLENHLVIAPLKWFSREDIVPFDRFPQHWKPI